MIRQAVVAGQFYPSSASALEKEVRRCLSRAPAVRTEPTILAMAPHAGYVYSGEVAGITLGQANLTDTILLLGPNHTGMGTPLSVWNRGQWLTPMGAMDIDEALADALIAADSRLTADRAAHVQEHSLEVMLPFLCAIKGGGFKGVPVAVAEHKLSELSGVAKNISKVLASWPGPVSMVVSSDMSHYVSHERAKELDSMALSPVLELDPVGLYSTVREAGISMCGVLPMTLGLLIALEMGAKKAELAAYATSGDASGDYSKVVGYAGVLVS
ncbi:MAG: AmmeMemoRadiSam system protein B [Desulfovibrio sp.]|nr:AmmeMemoRadiSam system protein B [Desulfovibrio sp.]MBI4961510.1 AmmeMemoRadiSam system protein B [Desulfovibrio sp.]